MGRIRVSEGGESASFDMGGVSPMRNASEVIREYQDLREQDARTIRDLRGKVERLRAREGNLELSLSAAMRMENEAVDRLRAEVDELRRLADERLAEILRLHELAEGGHSLVRGVASR